MSYNSTGFNSIKTEWIRNLCKTANIDLFSIQEHFNSTKSVHNYCKDQFPSYSSYVIPAKRSENQDSGRAKGGLAQFWKKTLKIKIERISTCNARIQAQILVFPTTRIMWINTYLPNDPMTLRFDDNELFGVLLEIEDILEKHDYDDCILQGDLNWDMSRSTGFSTSMQHFIDRNWLRPFMIS